MAHDDVAFRSARAGAVAAVSGSRPAECGSICTGPARGAAFAAAGPSGSAADPDRAQLHSGLSVSAGGAAALLSAGRQPQCRSAGAGLRRRLRGPLLGWAHRACPGDLRKDDQLEKLSAGLSAGVRRGADGRRGNAGRNGRLRAAAFRVVPAGAVHSALGRAAAAKLPCHQHGVLHQHPERPCRRLPLGGQAAAKRGSASPGGCSPSFWGCSGS